MERRRGEEAEEAARLGQSEGQAKMGVQCHLYLAQGHPIKLVTTRGGGEVAGGEGRGRANSGPQEGGT